METKKFPPMNFGCHRGTPINEIPEQYLRWCLDPKKCGCLNRSLRAAIEEYLNINPKES